MSPDEQEALTIRYRCLYQFARLRSGNFAIITSQQSNRKVAYLGDAAGAVNYFASLSPDAFIAAPPPPVKSTTLSAEELSSILGDLL